MQKDYGRKKYQSKHKKNSKKGTNTIILISIICLFVILVINFSGYYSTQLITTEYGVLREEFTSEGLIIRDETLIVAPTAGEIRLSYNAGERIGAGNYLATIYNDKEKKIYNYQSGLISYSPDGLEETLNFTTMKELDYDKFNNLKGKKNSLQSGDAVNRGRPIFKIINNSRFYLAVLLSQDKLLRYETGGSVTLEIEEIADEKFRGVISNILLDNPANIMLIEIKKFIPEIIDFRRVEVDILRREYKGLIVPSDVVTKIDGVTKVKVNGYISDYYREVEVIGEVGDQVAIRGVGPGVKLIKLN